MGFNGRLVKEKQKEKDRSVAMLRRKDQDMQIKDQQLSAARARIDELEEKLATSTGEMCGDHADLCAKGKSAMVTSSQESQARSADASSVTALPPISAVAR